MSWRLARSIALLRHEVDTAYPDRSKASDGTLGDQDHANRISDHNPDSQGRVCAIDITHDPAHGCDAGELAERFRKLGAAKDCRIKYVIWNRRITSASSAWAWRAYDGSNPHTKHVHLSVTQACADSTEEWEVTDMPLSSEDVNKVVAGVLAGVRADSYGWTRYSMKSGGPNFAAMYREMYARVSRYLDSKNSENLALLRGLTTDFDELAEAVAEKLVTAGTGATKDSIKAALVEVFGSLDEVGTQDGSTPDA